ncbi:MAG: hypothetical protein FD177_246 [Desulfovibrionaceae bacterium]|nr:MAG: hypothetical protein FD177_246 [Desulfovibrionaceae bacterium]
MTRALVLILLLSLPVSALAHGGGLDGYGGHHNRKAGGYHIHRGPLAGKHYASQAEMLQDLKKQQAPKAEAQQSQPKKPGQQP